MGQGLISETTGMPLHLGLGLGLNAGFFGIVRFCGMISLKTNHMPKLNIFLIEVKIRAIHLLVNFIEKYLWKKVL